MELTKQQILDAIEISNTKVDLVTNLNTTRYFLEKYLTQFNIKLPFVQISPYKLEHWINKGYSVVDAQRQIDIRSIYKKAYWIHKYGEIIGLQKHYEFKSRGARGKSHTVERKEKNKRTLEYWLKQGEDVESAKISQKKEQATFSLQTCVDKFGEVDGQLVFNERQMKWQNTLNLKSKTETDDINERKNANSIQFCKINFGDNWKVEYINRNLSKNTKLKLIITNSIKYDNLSELILNIKSIAPEWKYLYRFLRSKFTQDIFEISADDVDEIHTQMMLIYGIDNYKKVQYGTRIEYNGIVYKSKGEFEIAKYLTMNNIDFLYEKTYPFKQRFKYDFYIKKHNMYIEFTGLMSKKSYRYKLERKRKLCLEYNLNVLFSDKVNVITDYINKLK